MKKYAIHWGHTNLIIPSCYLFCLLILYYGCSSSATLRRSQDSESEIRTVLSEEELVAWKADSLGQSGSRESIYLRKGGEIQKLRFKGKKMAAIEAILGPSIQDSFAEFVSSRYSSCIYYPISEPQGRPGSGSSIGIYLTYSKLSGRVKSQYLSAYRDPTFAKPYIQHDFTCPDLLSGIKALHRSYDFTDGSWRYRHETMTCLNNNRDQLSIDCVEEIYGQPTNYVCHFYSDTSQVSYYYQLSKKSIRFDFDLTSFICLGVSMDLY